MRPCPESDTLQRITTMATKSHNGCVYRADRVTHKRALSNAVQRIAKHGFGLCDVGHGATAANATASDGNDMSYLAHAVTIHAITTQPMSSDTPTNV